MEPTLNDIDEMIVHEKMQAALEYQNEAWADGMADGIEPEIIADAAFARGRFGLTTRLIHFLRLRGQGFAAHKLRQKQTELSGIDPLSPRRRARQPAPTSTPQGASGDPKSE